MKALVFHGVDKPLTYGNVVKPVAEIKTLVRLEAAALNHRDVWITKGKYPGIEAPKILGSDGAGRVGDREVIINPNINWGNDDRFASKKFNILGMPANGTFAEYVAVEEDRLVDKPIHLSFEQAAALPLAGLTAYRALFTKCRLKRNERVLISGIGGGVALMACQFALAAGAEVYVTSGSQDKIDRAVKLGARGGASYREENWHKSFGKETGGFDVIVDSAGGKGFASLVKLCRPGARIVVYGGSKGTWDGVSPQVIFWKQVSIFGTSMGTDAEFREMVEFVNRYHVKPVVDQVIPLKEGQRAFDRMAAGEQFGKIVLKIGEN